MRAGACSRPCMVLPVWPAAVSWAASVIEPTAEVGFWALLAVASRPNRAAEPRERACENQSLGFFPSLTPVMRTESVRKGLRVHEKRSSEVQFKEKHAYRCCWGNVFSCQSFGYTCSFLYAGSGACMNLYLTVCSVSGLLVEMKAMVFGKRWDISAVLVMLVCYVISNSLIITYPD